MAGYEEVLINSFRNFPVLFDLADRNYKNEPMRVNAWHQILDDLRAVGFTGTVEELKAKMKSLRDVYVRYKKKNDAAIKSGAPASSTPSWEFWGLMTWLDDYRKRRRTSTNMSVTVIEDESVNEVTDESNSIGTLTLEVDDLESSQFSEAVDPTSHSITFQPISSPSYISSTSASSSRAATPSAPPTRSKKKEKESSR
ncbi:uncharacterized protein LOC124433726 [Xenia sp. Carnegie-2017]|uniref:uncharacterized protein LOC124433726 n=1 Tax=Xenia sp. Carnegie-2017 TaxID=2897299 RepID=UPI001F03840E|nr:uncharacterized protein LOC124433726 [Xenia sp. Carnegie-2017]